jgi:hypothetical protein
MIPLPTLRGHAVCRGRWLPQPGSQQRTGLHFLGFSSVLAFFGLFGWTLRGTRFVNALLFGLNAGMLGVLVWRMTPSLTAGVVIAALFVASGEMLQIHAVAMSEPLFIFLSLLSFWMFDLYFEFPPSSVGKGISGEWWWLVACASFAGMAYLTLCRFGTCRNVSRGDLSLAHELA